MATDPGMLQDWYKSYSAKNLAKPIAQAPAMQGGQSIQTASQGMLGQQPPRAAASTWDNQKQSDFAEAQGQAYYGMPKDQRKAYQDAISQAATAYGAPRGGLYPTDPAARDEYRAGEMEAVKAAHDKFLAGRATAAIPASASALPPNATAVPPAPPDPMGRGSPALTGHAPALTGPIGPIGQGSPTPPVATYAPTQAAASMWSPDSNSTVQGQLGGMLRAGSPLQDIAATQAKQGMAERGLLSSSIALSAGQEALYKSALPIAQQDASTYADAGRTNANLGTQVSVNNAGSSNDAGRFNAGAANEMERQRAGFGQQNKLQEGDFGQQAKIQASDLASRYNLANMDVQSRQSLQAADSANQQKLQAANAVLQTGLQATDNAVRQSMQQYQLSVTQAMNGLDNQSRLQIATMDANTRTSLAAVESKYRVQMQASQSMSNSYQSLVDSISRVMIDPSLDGQAKQKNIDNLTQLYDNTLKLQSSITGLNLGSLLSGDVAPAAPAAPAPATPNAPATPAIPGGYQTYDDRQNNLP